MQQYARFYALDQSLSEGDRVAFLPDVYNSRFVTLTADSKGIRIARGGTFLIASDWTTVGTGALSMVSTLNGAKIPYMNYVSGLARNSLTSIITGCKILVLRQEDILSIVNYAPESILSVPVNNTSDGSSSNSAATLTVIMLSDYT